MIITAIKEHSMDKQTPEESKESPDDVLPAPFAAAYVGHLYGRPFTTKDFGNLRTNHAEEIAALGIEPVYRSGSDSSWRRGDLDIIAANIPAPVYRPSVRKERKKRKSKRSEG